MISARPATPLRFLALLVLLLLSTGSLQAQPPTNGLIAFWPFNGNALDASGNGRNGAVWGPTLVNDRFGNSGAAYYFDGVSDSIVVPDHPSFQFRMTDSYSISLWMKSCDPRDDFLSTPRLLFGHPPGHGGNAGFFYIAYLQTPLISRFAVAVNGTIPVSPNGGYFDGLWHHVVLTVADTLRAPEANSSRWTRVYIDGQRVINRSDPGVVNGRNNDVIVNDALRFGSSFGNDSYEGAIDDARVYNRALSQAEVTAIYTENGWPGSAPSEDIAFDLVAVGDTAICPGDTVQLRVTGTYDSRLWTSSTAGLIDIGSDNPRAAPTQTTTYELEATRQTIGPPCEVNSTAKRSVTITVLEAPTIQASQIVACATGTEQINASATGGAGGYQWTWSPATGLDDSTLARPTITLDENTPQSYSVTVTDAKGCTTSRSISVLLVEPPTLELFSLRPDTMRVDTIYICRGEELELVALARGPESRYIYAWNDPSSLDRIDSSHVRARPAAPTSYQVEITDGGGVCPPQIDSIVVVPVDPPVIDAGTNGTICRGKESVLLGDDSNDPTLVYAWRPAAGLDDSTLARPTASPSTTTRYYLEVTDTIAGCTAIDSVDIAVTDVRPRIDLARIDFGALGGCRTDTTLTVAVANDGTSTMQLQTIEDAQGTVLSPDAPTDIPAGTTTAIRLRYTPATSGVTNGMLVFRFGPCGDSLVVPFTGEKGEAGVTVSVRELDFGRLPYCDPAVRQRQSFVVRNGSVEEADVTRTVIYEPNPADNVFNIAVGGSGNVVAAGDSLIFTVDYNPSGIGDFTRTVHIPYSSGSCLDTLRVLLRAELYRPELTADPREADFGILNGCTTDREITIDLTNPETREVDIHRVEVPGDLTVVLAPSTIGGNGTSEALTLRYAPTASGDLSGLVRVIYGPCNDTLTLPLSGRKRGITFTLPDTIDFGDLCLGDALDRSLAILLDSEGTGNGSITSATITGDFASDITPGDILRDRSAADYTVTANPTAAGDVIGELVVRLEPCDVERRIVLRARATAVILDVEPVDFGLRQVGTNPQGILRAINRAATPLTIERIDELTGFDRAFELLPITPPLPITLQPGDTLALTVDYEVLAGIDSATVGFVLENPCDTSVVGRIRGEGEASASARIVVVDLTAAPGERVELVLRLDGESGLDGLPIGGFTATVVVEPSMLVVDDASLQQDVGDEREITIVGTYSAGDPILARIPSTALLGRAETTPLRLVDFDFTETTGGGPVPIAIERVDGELTMSGLCREGGTRLFDPNGSVAIKSITPNPAGEQVTITYSIVEPGAYRMSLVDMAGRTIAEIFAGSLVPGSYRATGALGQLPTGTYRLLLETPTLRVSEELRVVE